MKPRNRRRLAICALSFAVVLLMGCTSSEAPSGTAVIVEPWTGYTPKQEVALIESLRKSKNSGKELYDVYRDLTVIDIHNHDAENPGAIDKWGRFGIDGIVLFGDISEPSAMETDKRAWEQYRKEPSRVYPSFAGFPIYEDEGLSIVQQNLENGYLNIGEVAAASTHSPVVSKVAWKAKHPNDGNFPKIYDLAAKYRVPILLHIDPPFGEPIVRLEEALDQHPDTAIIFAHANAYNPPENIEPLLKKHSNLYIDFSAGFTAYNSESTNKLADFVPLIERYPDRFMLSTDSGYGLTTEEAAKALYEIIDLLSPETALKVAYQNYERLIELQPPTDTQIRTIQTLSARSRKFGTYRLNKRLANELIFRLTDLTR